MTEVVRVRRGMPPISGAQALHLSQQHDKLNVIAATDLRTTLAFSQHFLDNEDLWGDAEGNVWKLREMEPRHIYNVISFLLRHAVALEFDYGLHYAVMVGAHEETFGVPDDFDIPDFHGPDDPDWGGVDLSTPEGQEAYQKKCEEWVEGTPLMQALRTTYEAWESDGSFI